MPGIFTFIGHDFQNIFQQNDLFLPGIGKVIGVYHSASDRELKMVIRSQKGEVECEDVLSSRENMVAIQKLREKNKHFEWHDKKELPFERMEEKPVKQSKNAIQASIFDELQKVVLLLRYRNEFDGKYDLIVIYFNQDNTNFGISKGQDPMSTETKSATGHIFYHYFKSILSLNKHNTGILKSLQENMRAIIRENMDMKDELQRIRQNHGESLTGLCQSFVQEISVKYGRQFILSDDALEKIRDFQGNIRHLNRIMENAVSFTENLSFDSREENLNIHAYALNFDDLEVNTSMDEAVRKIDSRESKTMMLLDKFENAALVLKNKKMSMTGLNLGQAMPVPISPPAITDAIKKHRKLIIQLFAKYPEKWDNIRKEFRPIRNLVDQHDDNRLNVESA